MGRFCAACGQRVDANVHSVWEFVGEALEDITNADSRVWRTLVPLLTKPGRLTQEFFIGRRARYLPPVRLYLVLSLCFFIAASLRPSDGPGIALGGDPAQRAEMLSDLGREINGIVEPERRAAVAERFDQARRRIEGQEDSAGTTDRGPFTNQACGELEGSAFGVAIEQTLRRTCEAIAADGGRAFLDAFINNLPSAMFIFLPLFALVMKLLYPFSRRYFMEHLLVLVHSHAAVFLMLLLYEVLALVTPNPWHGFFVFALFLYVPWYTYRCMRVFYGQGRFVTFLKWSTIGMSYLTVGTLMLFLTAAFSALTL